MAEKSRREILLEAFDEAEREETSTETTQRTSTENTGPDDAPDTSASAADSQTTERTGGEDTGKEVTDGKTDDKKPAKSTKPETADEKERKAAAEADRQRQLSARTEGANDRAPASWKPAEREHWAKMPAGARAAVIRRESEITRELSQHAGLRKFSDAMAQIVQPHLPQISAMKTNPLGAIESMFGTARSLYSGTQEQKAQTIADLISTYSVDIRTLDSILAKKPLPKNTGTDFNPNAIPPWAQPLLQHVQTQQQREQQYNEQVNQEAVEQIEEAKQHMPFLEDLREDVADILERAANRGRTMSLKQAYDRAVQLDPEISKVVAQREAAARAQNGGNANLQRKRQAASSVRGGTPNGGTSAGKPQTRREVLAALWDERSE